eukprot:maker-scaffold308_size214241-snap-gene-1.45 protein:Tk09067 transcript:maker-scaffold308_size214241-snap-gene-1.45-mRNA-1 annotation:"fad-dependent oxidoreductase domain-containing protein 1-like"
MWLARFAGHRLGRTTAGPAWRSLSRDAPDGSPTSEAASTSSPASLVPQAPTAFPPRSMVDYPDEDIQVSVMSEAEEEYRLKVKDSYLIDYTNRQSLTQYLFKKPLESSYETNRPLANPYERAFDQLRPWSRRRTKFYKEDFKHAYDICIVGGGLIGLSTAFHIADRYREKVDVCVVERDPTYRQCTSTVTGGHIRLQYNQPENIEMSQYGVDFFRNAARLLYVNGAVHQPRIPYRPHGLLALGQPDQNAVLEAAHQVQTSFGVRSELLSPAQIQSRFPYMNTADISLGTYGAESAGWIEPFPLMANLKLKCAELGVTFIHGDVYNMVHRLGKETMFVKPDGTRYGTNEVVDEKKDLLKEIENRVCEAHIHLPDGDVWPLHASRFVLAGGHQNGHLGRLCGMGLGQEFLQVPIPVEPRKRYFFKISAPQGPGLNCPLVIDPSGAYMWRSDFGGVYTVSRPPGQLDNEPSTANLDVDMDYFHEWVMPPLVQRVPSLKNAEVLDAYATLEDYNFFDGSPIVGPHPTHANVFLAVGGSGIGIQHAPAIGRAVSEYIFEGDYQTLDLKHLGVWRLLRNQEAEELMHLC